MQSLTVMRRIWQSIQQSIRAIAHLLDIRSLRRTHNRVYRLLAMGMLVGFWAIAWSSVGAGQVPNLTVQTPNDIEPSTHIKVERLGNIEYAHVRFDGRLLFQVAAPAADTLDEDSMTPTVQQRVKHIQTNLSEVVAQEPDPDELQVIAGQLNNQPVIFVSGNMGLRRIQIVTITELDTRISGVSESDLVQDWITIIGDRLRQALQERQPDYLKAQAIRALQALAGMIIASILVALVQRFLKAKWNQLNCQVITPHKMPDDIDGISSMQDLAVNHPLRFLALHLPQLTLARQRNINLILRRLLQWTQVAIWLGGTIWILTLFPQTREQGQWLSGLPIRLLGILVVMGLANKVSQVLIDKFLQAWAEQESLKPIGAHRQACRVPTYSVALKGMSTIASIVVGGIWVLYELRVPIAPVLTGAGILGFALSFSAQSLIRDMINGSLILLEDQYAVGDVISVGNEMGFVEYVNLRITQIRDPDGELVTIPNGSITTVRNLSNGWSRVNLEIEVSYDVDVDRALQVLEHVAEDMRHESLWKDRILEPADILGIDKLAHDGILIRVWIKTKPLQQWNVSREFRRRLKLAFEAHNIPIGVPQQFIWIRNGSDLATFEQARRSHASSNGKDEPDSSPQVPLS